MGPEKHQMELHRAISYGQNLIGYLFELREITHETDKAIEIIRCPGKSEPIDPGLDHDLIFDFLAIQGTVERIVNLFTNNPSYIASFKTLNACRGTDKVAEEVFKALCEYIPDLPKRITQTDSP